MKKLLLMVMLSFGASQVMAADLPEFPISGGGQAADTDQLDFDYEDILDHVDDAQVLLRERGVIRDIDLVKRTIEISGFLYHVPPLAFEYPLEVSLYGTTAGSFELLQVGMKVEVEFIEVQRLARAAFAVTELAPSTDVEH